MGDCRFSLLCCGGFRSVIVLLCVCVVPDVLKDCGNFRPLGTTFPMTQHHILKHKEPPAARQHSITSQNVGNHLLPDNIASHPKTKGTTYCQTTQYHIPKHTDPLAARQHSITFQNTRNHLLPDTTASHPKTQGTTCCQTTQHHVPKQREPLAARQHSITSQNKGNHLLPDNTASCPKTQQLTF